MTISISSSRRALVGTIGALTFQFLVAALAAGAIALPGCPESCGGIRVPYPLGIGPGCFREGFDLTCDETQHPPKLFLGDGVEVLGISLPDGTVRIRSNVLRSDSREFNGSWSGPAVTGPFSVSSGRNWFVAVGCNIVAQLIPQGAFSLQGDTSTCAATCVDRQQKLIGTSCSGIARCRASIAWELPSYGIQIKELAVLGPGIGFSSYTDVFVFIVDQDWFSRKEDEMLSNYTYYPSTVVQSVPAVLSGGWI